MTIMTMMMYRYSDSVQSDTGGHRRCRRSVRRRRFNYQQRKLAAIGSAVKYNYFCHCFGMKTRVAKIPTLLTDQRCWVGVLRLLCVHQTLISCQSFVSALRTRQILAVLLLPPFATVCPSLDIRKQPYTPYAVFVANSKLSYVAQLFNFLAFMIIVRCIVECLPPTCCTSASIGRFCRHYVPPCLSGSLTQRRSHCGG